MKETALPAGWDYVKAPDLAIYAAMWGSYRARDSIGWLDFFNELKESLCFLHRHGWICLSDSVPGVSATLHGAGWGHKNPILPRTIPKILDFAMGHLRFKAIHAQVPDDQDRLIGYLKRFGFVETGRELIAASYDGKVLNHVNLIYTSG